jgi:hypothetical protein
MVQSQPWEVVLKTLSQNTHHKERAGGMVQGVGSEFKPQYHKKIKKKRTKIEVSQFMISRNTTQL